MARTVVPLAALAVTVWAASAAEQWWGDSGSSQSTYQAAVPHCRVIIQRYG